MGENRRTVEAVYGYYGRLFTGHPYLRWAGPAAMIGPAFYAGFRDLGVLPDAVREAVTAALGRASRRLAGRAAGDLGFTRRRSSPCIIDTATLEAWRQIDAGRRDPRRRSRRRRQPDAAVPRAA
ncbi:MAG TPA: hypothetical protein VG123_12000 [Streptosporangiaceae bacterium]|nr:hypothetical protein [Streptosporangiaceae bacterium]